MIDKTELLKAYEGNMTRLIPLHAWDHVDENGVLRGKSPLHTNWQRQYDQGDVFREIERGSNVGFRMSEFDMIIDLDPRNMSMSMDNALSEIGRKYDMDLDLEKIFHVKTGGGGLHVYLKIPEEWVGTKFRNGLMEFEGVEFKTFGKQVVAAGSRHPETGSYYRVSPGVALEASGKLLIALRRESKSSNRTSESLPEGKVAELLSYLDPCDYSDNESWLQLAMACHDASNGADEDAFVEWSLQDEEYSDQEEVIRARWNSITDGGGITVATLYKAVKESGNGSALRGSAVEAFGASPPTPLEMARYVPNMNDVLFERTSSGMPKRTVDNVKRAILGLGLEPSRNVLTGRNIINGNQAILSKYFPGAGDTVSDDMLHGLRAAIQAEFNFEPTIQQTSEGLSALALLYQFHPIREYIDALEWDGEDRVSTFFSSYCQSPCNPYTIAVAEVLFKAAVGRVYRPGIKYDTMVILEGRQGCGKSTLVSNLGGEWALEGLPNKSDMNDKDVIQQIQGSWLVEVEELAVMRKSDIDSMKAFLTRQVDTARFAYAREAREYPRQCVFIGTTNDDEYLLDSTGNRRFLPIKVGSIDLVGIKEDRDQIWAQAKVMWDKKPTAEALMLHEDMWSTAAAEQSQRRIMDPVEYQMATYLNSLDPEVTFVDQPTLLREVLHRPATDCGLAESRRVSRAGHTIPGWYTSVDADGTKGMKREPSV